MNLQTDKMHKRATKMTGASSSKNRKSLSEIDTLFWRVKARLNANSSEGQVIAMTSCCRESGVSTLIANLAVRATDNHMGPVLIIDANIAAPRQHRLFRQKAKFGLVDVLVGAMAPAEAVIHTNIEALDIIPLGLPSHFEAARVVSLNCDEMFRWARDHYAIVFVDLPQIEDLRHGLMIARQADMTLVAVRSDTVRRTSAAQSVERLISDGVNVAGTILSRQTVFTPRFLRN